MEKADNLTDWRELTPRSPKSPRHSNYLSLKIHYLFPQFSHCLLHFTEREKERFRGRKMEGAGRESAAVPESVMDSVKRTLVYVEEVRTQLPEFLSLSDPEVLAELPPLQRAQSLLLLAKATSILFTLRLRCTGVHPDDHPVKSELERLSSYQDKLERFINWSKAPLRPSATLNYQAATRFIQHSLPDLTPEQKQNMNEISKGEGPRIKYLERSAKKKRKYQSSEKQSVQAAAKEFLEKAARELLGDNNDGFKGPLQLDADDDDDLPVG